MGDALIAARFRHMQTVEGTYAKTIVRLLKILHANGPLVMSALFRTRKAKDAEALATKTT
jgi:hypothetical protein